MRPWFRWINLIYVRWTGNRISPSALYGRFAGGIMIMQFNPWSFPPQNVGDWLTLGQLACLFALVVVLAKSIWDNR